MDTEHNAIIEPVRRLECSPALGGGGHGVMKTRRGLFLRSRRAETRSVQLHDAMDYRHGSCLAGAVNSERLEVLRLAGCSLCRRLWMRNRLPFHDGGRRMAKSMPAAERSRSVEVEDVLIRVGRGAGAETFMVVLRALKASK
jgi:hypothetical protein